MAIYGDLIERVGEAARTVKANGPHKFKQAWYEMVGSGDMRGEYVDGIFSAAGAAGEALRLRGIANALLTATGGTINALHATGRVAAGKTVSGALNAIRATLEVAGTNPTPGGTLSALQLDTNFVSGTTLGNNDALVRVSESGTPLIKNLFNIESSAMTDGSNSPDDHLVSSHADHASTHLIKCRVNGADMWLLATNSHT